MAVINLKHSYAKTIEKRFAHDSVTESCFSKELDVEFHGVKSVTVSHNGVAPVNDYVRSGDNRFGTVNELDDYEQEFVMTQDKSSTWSIDKGNQAEQYNQKQAGQTLKEQMRQVYTPMIDKYRIQRWADGAGKVIGLTAAPTKSNIIEKMLDMDLAMDDVGVPEEGRFFYIPTTYYKYFLRSDEFQKADALLIKALGKKTVGTLFGKVAVKCVPPSWMPEDVYLMEVYKGAAISPVKLQTLRILTEQRGIDGDVVEMRFIYDAFVRGTKAEGISLSVASSKAVAAPTVTFSSNVATMASTTSGATIVYTTDGGDPRYSKHALVYNAESKPTIAAGATVRAAAKKTGMFQSSVTEATNS